MPQRRDAFSAAAEIALAIESAARSTGAEDTVATTGVCQVFPGAINSIPSRVRLEIDVRDIDGERRDAVLRRIEEDVDAVAKRRNVSVQTERMNADPPLRCDPLIVQTLMESAQAQQVSYELMISRAYHDSLFMSRVAPAAMLFIPCRGGVSHRPDEYSSPEAIAKGTLVLAETLARLATQE
jgi:N-carbamoyl-L-amino-acid hydrolase